MKKCILERDRSSLHNSAFLLVAEQVGLLGIVTWANNYGFLVALLLMVSQCQVLLAGELWLHFSCTVWAFFLFSVNSTSPLGAQSIFQKAAFSNRKLDQESATMLGGMYVQHTVILGNTASSTHAFSSQALTELWKEKTFKVNSYLLNGDDQVILLSGVHRPGKQDCQPLPFLT